MQGHHQQQRQLKQLGLAVSTLTLAALLAGCGHSAGTSGGSASTTTGGSGASPSGGITVTYAIVPKALNNPVFTMAEVGAKDEAAQLEKQNPGTHYNIIYQASQSGAASEQANIIDTLGTKHVDGISLSAIDPNAVQKSINDAVDGGVPVMCFDSDAPASKRSTLYSVSDEEIGQELGRQLVNAAGGKANMTGEVAILSGQSSALNLQNRVKGVQDALDAKDYPGVKLLPILYCDDDIAKSVDLIHSTIAAHPKLRGFIFVGGWPLFAKNALDGVDPKVTSVVSVDTLPVEMPYLNGGQVYCLIGQKYYGWGQESVKTLEDIRTGKQKTPPAFIDSGYDLVYKNPNPAELALKKGDIGVYSSVDYAKQWAIWSGNGNQIGS